MELGNYRDLAFSNPEEIKRVQQERLKEHLLYCSNHSPYYQKIIKEQHIQVEAIALENLADFPLTDKSQIEQYNNDFIAVPEEKVTDIVVSSGTTGVQTRMMYSNFDLRRLAYNEEMSLGGCGIEPCDRVLLTCTLDRLFIAGLAYFLGIRNLGAAAIRNGQNTLESHLEVIQRLQPTAIVGVPGFLKKLGIFMLEAGTNPAETKVDKIVCIGESLRDQNLELLKTGEDLQRIWQAEVFSTYASSEIVTSFCECPQGNGGHLLPDLGIVEIIDDNDSVLPPGQVGEVVMTPLVTEAMPLIRFKTGDISFLMDDPCGCGRFSPRIGPILGRKKHMLKVKGTTLYPQAIFTVLEEIEEIQEYFVIATTKSGLSDHVSVHIAVSDPTLTTEIVQNKLQARVRVKPSVVVDDISTVRQRVFNPNSRKPVRFFDNRI
jgi:phenylacetate-CoA ligase